MEIIRVMREKLQLSQGDLAEIVGVNRSTVSKWERGILTPRTKKIPKLATALKCSVGELLTS